MSRFLLVILLGCFVFICWHNLSFGFGHEWRCLMDDNDPFKLTEISSFWVTTFSRTCFSGTANFLWRNGVSTFFERLALVAFGILMDWERFLFCLHWWFSFVNEKKKLWLDSWLSFSGVGWNAQMPQILSDFKCRRMSYNQLKLLSKPSNALYELNFFYMYTLLQSK